MEPDRGVYDKLQSILRSKGYSVSIDLLEQFYQKGENKGACSYICFHCGIRSGACQTIWDFGWSNKQHRRFECAHVCTLEKYRLFDKQGVSLNCKKPSAGGHPAINQCAIVYDPKEWGSFEQWVCDVEEQLREKRNKGDSEEEYDPQEDADDEDDEYSVEADTEDNDHHMDNNPAEVDDEETEDEDIYYHYNQSQGVASHTAIPRLPPPPRPAPPPPPPPPPHTAAPPPPAAAAASAVDIIHPYVSPAQRPPLVPHGACPPPQITSIHDTGDDLSGLLATKQKLLEMKQQSMETFAQKKRELEAKYTMYMMDLSHQKSLIIQRMVELHRKETELIQQEMQRYTQSNTRKRLLEGDKTSNLPKRQKTGD